MSRSDNTEWHREYCRHWQHWSFGSDSTGRLLRRAWQKRQRQRERAALRRFEEPEPTRTRSSVKYDYW